MHDLSLPLALAHAKHCPGIRHWTDRNGDQRRFVGTDRFLERRSELLRSVSLPANDAERLGKLQEVWIQQVGSDRAASKLLLLNATHVPEGVVGEDDGDRRDPVESHGRELAQAKSEAT